MSETLAREISVYVSFFSLIVAGLGLSLSLYNFWITQKEKKIALQSEIDIETGGSIILTVRNPGEKTATIVDVFLVITVYCFGCKKKETVSLSIVNFDYLVTPSTFVWGHPLKLAHGENARFVTKSGACFSRIMEQENRQGNFELRQAYVCFMDGLGTHFHSRPAQF